MPDPEQTPVSLKTWIAVGGAMIGSFISVLNIHITNASLRDIEGGISTGGINGAWITTAYLIGEIVVIPLSDYLSRVFSLRRYLMGNIALFMLFSALCGQATSLPEMIVLRALQGFAAGVLIPLAFTIVVIMLPVSKRAIGMAAFAITSTFAPAIGPTVGGYVSDAYGWSAIFYVNLVPGALMLAMLGYALPAAKPNYALLARGDWLGILLMAIGLAALQTVLDEGNVLDWFGSPLIIRLSVIATLALGAFLIVQVTRPKPLLNLRLLARRNFGFGTTANVMLGFALYGAAYLQPQYLANAQGYNAQQIGAVMAWTGLPQLLIIPLVPMMMRRIDPRAMVVFGLTLFAASSFMNLNLDADYAAPQLLLPNVTRAFGQAISLAPLSTIALAGIASHEAGNASGIYNMLRNLGGAVGTAMVESFYTQREQYHSFIINQHVSLLQPATRERLAHLRQYFLAHGADPSAALHDAVVAIGRAIQRQSVIMAYGDSFALLGLALLLGAAAVLPMRRGTRSGAGAAH